MTHPIDYRVHPKADGTAARATALAVILPQIEAAATGQLGKKGKRDLEAALRLRTLP